MAGDYDELQAVLRELLTNRFAPKPEYTRGLLGDGLGNVKVPGRPDKNYARFNRGSTEYFEIFNVTVPPVDGWPVLIGELPWLPGLTQVVGTDWAAYEQSGWGDSISSTSPHAPTHEWPDGSPGADPVSIYMRSIVPLRGYSLGTGSTTFYANSYEYENANGSGTVWGGLPGVDLQPVMASLTTGTAKLMGVYLDPITNTLGIVTGTTDIFTDASDPPAPIFPNATLPVARVRVYGGQSSIGEIDIRDARRPFELSGGGSGFLRADGTTTGATSQAQVFTNDIKPLDDLMGAGRRHNWGFTAIEEHFQEGGAAVNSFNPALWDGWVTDSGFITPTELGIWPSMMTVYLASGTAPKAFLPYTWSVPGTPATPYNYGALALSTNAASYSGFRMDDWNGATVSNYVETALRYNTTNRNIELISNSNGSITVRRTFDWLGFYLLRWISFSGAWSNWNLASFIGHPGNPKQFSMPATASGLSWTPTRGGMVIGSPTTTPGTAEQFLFDWIKE